MYCVRYLILFLVLLPPRQPSVHPKQPMAYGKGVWPLGTLIRSLSLLTMQRWAIRGRVSLFSLLAASAGDLPFYEPHHMIIELKIKN